jgi:hypothetical protein
MASFFQFGSTLIAEHGFSAFLSPASPAQALINV